MKFKLVENIDSKYERFSIDIPYKRLTITIPSATYQPSSQTSYGWDLPEEDEQTINWNHTIGWNEFNEALWEIIEDDGEEINWLVKEAGKENLSDKEIDKFLNSKEYDEYIYNNANKLLNRYKEQFKDYFEEEAIEEASDYYRE